MYVCVVVRRRWPSHRTTLWYETFWVWLDAVYGFIVIGAIKACFWFCVSSLSVRCSGWVNVVRVGGVHSRVRMGRGGRGWAYFVFSQNTSIYTRTNFRLNCKSSVPYDGGWGERETASCRLQNRLRIHDIAKCRLCLLQFNFNERGSIQTNNIVRWVCAIFAL